MKNKVRGFSVGMLKFAVIMAIILGALAIIPGCGGGGVAGGATGGSGGGSSSFIPVWTAPFAEAPLGPFEQFMTFTNICKRAHAAASDMMRGIHAVDDNIQIGVGDYGQIEISTDGGTTWTDRSTTSDQFRDCRSIDGTTIFVAGMNGSSIPSLKKSINGGVNFADQAIGGKDPINIGHIFKISMPAAGALWAACSGGVILTKADGSLLGTGRSQSVLENGTGNGLSNVTVICGVSAEEAWFGTVGGGVYHTTDRLTTEADGVRVMTGGCYGIDALPNGTNAWMVGREIHHWNSTTGWEIQNNVTGISLGSFTLTDVKFQNANRGIAVGYSDEASPTMVILRTNNGGSSWAFEAPPSGANERANAISFSPSGKVYGATRAHIVRAQQ